VARGDLTNAQWAVLETLLPKGRKTGRPPTWARRELIDGIRFRVRTGIPWRGLPAEYGPWGRAYDLFRRWQRDGTWHRIFTELQARAVLSLPSSRASDGASAPAGVLRGDGPLPGVDSPGRCGTGSEGLNSGRAE
jgi:transposase